MIITITGTPGVGKTFFAKKLAKALHVKYCDMNNFIKKNKLYDLYDKKDATYDVDVQQIKKTFDKKFERYLNSDPDGKSFYDTFLSKLELNKDEEYYINMLQRELFGNGKKDNLQNSNRVFNKDVLIIDGHLSHNLKSNMCVVIKTDIKKLHSRLAKRKYSRKKIMDNIESEIFDVCLEEAKNSNRNVLVVENGDSYRKLK